MTIHDDEALARVFGRPPGITGSFHAAEAHAPRRSQPQIQPPDPVLAEAFQRPEDEHDTLQRDPYGPVADDDEPEVPADPWRDPDARAQLAGPALESETPAEPSEPGAKLSVSELLFGRRVHWTAYVALAVVALLVGLVGGLIGRYTAEVVAPLHSDSVSLNFDQSGPVPEGAIAQVAEAVAPTVVTIEVRTDVSGASGSGFVVDERGYIATNNHVVTAAATNDTAKLEVVFNDRKRVPARLVGRDPKTDLAVIKVDDVDNLKVSALGNSSEVHVGENVLAFGSPLGLARTVTAGIVSAVDRPLALTPDAESDTDAVINAIQTDASINPGNSGGPLVDMKGRVIGVNTAGRMSGDGGSIGLGFAIPVNEAAPIIKGLINDGSVNHPQIGVSAATQRNNRVFGAEIVAVADGSPAARAGIKDGDVILKFGGRQIEGSEDLSVAIRNSKIGEPTGFTYWRDGREFQGTVTPESD